MGFVVVSGVARKNKTGPLPDSVEFIRICDDAIPVARRPMRRGAPFWSFDSTVEFEMKYLRVSVSSARANVCDEMKRSGLKSASTAAVDVSLAVVSTSYASMVTG